MTAKADSRARPVRARLRPGGRPRRRRGGRRSWHPAPRADPGRVRRPIGPDKPGVSGGGYRAVRARNAALRHPQRHHRPRGPRRGGRRSGPAGVHDRRPAGRRAVRGARARPRRAAQRRVPPPAAPDHGQPRAGGGAQGGRVAGPRDRARDPARVGAAPRRAGADRAASASSALGGDVRRVPGILPMAMALAAARRPAGRRAGRGGRGGRARARASSRSRSRRVAERGRGGPRVAVATAPCRRRCRGPSVAGPGRRRPADVGPRAGRRSGRRPRRRPRPGRRAAGARDRPGRRPRAAPDRAAGLGQDAARADDPRAAARPRRRGGARGDDRRVGGVEPAHHGARPPAARVRAAASHRSRTPAWSAVARGSRPAR